MDRRDSEFLDAQQKELEAQGYRVVHIRNAGGSAKDTQKIIQSAIEHAKEENAPADSILFEPHNTCGAVGFAKKVAEGSMTLADPSKAYATAQKHFVDGLKAQGGEIDDAKNYAMGLEDIRQILKELGLEDKIKVTSNHIDVNKQNVPKEEGHPEHPLILNIGESVDRAKFTREHGLSNNYSAYWLEFPKLTSTNTAAILNNIGASTDIALRAGLTHGVWLVATNDNAESVGKIEQWFKKEFPTEHIHRFDYSTTQTKTKVV